MADRTADTGGVHWGGCVGRTESHTVTGTARSCPDDADLAALVAGALDDRELAGLHQHCERCEKCSELLVQLARVQRNALDADAPTEIPARAGMRSDDGVHIDIGTRVDQYRVLRLIGEGGMGQVFAAEDSTLGRDVAIKAVRPRHASRDPQWTVRLVREAQAMAQLVHPNVLTVYGAGTHGADAYFAMELVDGETLGQWMVGEERSWREVLQIFIAAGRGLAAAHDAGLVHRDFKPSNVLVSRDDRVLVTDFGLVAQAGEEPSSVSGSAEIGASSWDADLTETGVLLGTLAYMAPEQAEATRADARADQFSFCVALAEALYGRHPFDRNIRAALTAATWAPELAERRGVPARLQRVLTRGLRRDPDDRYASMHALLEDLGGVIRARARLIGLVLGAGALGLAGFAGAMLSGSEPAGAPPPCPAPEEGHIPGVWDDDVRGVVSRQFDDLLILRTLDRYANAWTRMSHEACEATRVRGEHSEEVLDARTVCLDSRRRSLAAVTGMLSSGAVTELPRALDLAYALPGLQPCSNLRLLRYLDAPDPDPDKRAELDELESELWRTHALASAGSTGEAEETLARLSVRIDALGHKPLQAQARRILSVVVSSTDVDRSVTLMREGYQLAMVSHADDTAAELALSLAQTEAFERGDPDASRLWMDLAQSNAQRSELPIEHALSFARGAVSLAEGDCDTAIVEFSAAAEAGDGRWTGASVVGPAYANVAACHLQQGHPELAAAPLQNAIMMFDDIYGPYDQRTLDNVANAAAALRLQGDLVGAENALTDVLERQEVALGASHPSLAMTLMALAAVMRDTERARRALELDERALRIREAVFGPQSMKTASVLRSLATDSLALGDIARAVALRERAASILASTAGPEHPSTVEAREELAAAREQLEGDSDDAATPAAPG